MAGTDGYEWDLFVSYSRSGTLRKWVTNHLVPRLQEHLEDELPRAPRIFLDQDMDAGVEWPDHLLDALQRSRLLLAIWSPRYFESHWCMAEWHTFLRREEELLRLEPADPRPLVCPIRFSDGRTFPERARNTQQQTNFKKYKYPDPQFAGSKRYLGFRDEVMKLAERLAPQLQDPPPWRPDWPVERPVPQPRPPTRGPSLWGAS